MTNIKYFLVTYDRLSSKVCKKLSKEEKFNVYCYAVRKDIPKIIDKSVKLINEWELNWYDNRYQTLQYYEYGAIVHLLKNLKLLKNTSHVGLLHYDVIFNKNSINDIHSKLVKDPNQIFYVSKREDINSLYLSKFQLDKICNYMEIKLKIKIDSNYIWENGWISEALSVTPIDVFKKFGKFILENQYDFEDILRNNRWGVMNKVKHRPCGFVERMWGIYLMSLKMPMHQMNVIHDHNSYEHIHLKQSKDLRL